MSEKTHRLVSKKTDRRAAVWSDNQFWLGGLMLAAASIAVYFLSGLFVRMIGARIAFSLAGGYALSAAFKHYMDFRSNRICRDQTELLLSFLSTETSSGRSLDSAFERAPAHFADLYTRRNTFQASLEKVAAGLRLQIPLSVLLKNFAETLASKEAKVIVQVLAAAEQGGAELPEMLGESAGMLGSIKRIEREVASENAQQTSEAAILAAMPFGAMLMLSKGAGDYMSASFESLTGQIMLAASFVMAFMALVLNLHFRSKRPTRSNDESLTWLKEKLAHPSLFSNLASFLLTIIPKSWLLRIYAAQRILNGRGSAVTWLNEDRKNPGELNVWLQLKILWLVPATLISLLLFRGRLPVPYVIGLVFAVPLVQDFELLNRASRYQNELMQDLPLFVSLMKQLLQSGMVVQLALKFTLRQMPENSALFRELKNAGAGLTAGRNASGILSELAGRLDMPEIQTALLLLARQESHGGPEILRQLETAVHDCWSILGSAYRKTNERMRQMLLLPMMLDMFSIVLMSAAPALLMFMEG